MSSIGSYKNFSISMAQSLQEGTRLVMQDVQQNTARLDRRKDNVAQAGLDRLNRSNEIAQSQAVTRSKIDVFA